MRFALATVLLALTLGCGAGAKLGNVKAPGLRTSSAASEKDCKACEKACQVAGDAEKNPDAVEKCKKDCKKDCAG